MDFETRSAVDLKRHGAWRYAEDHTTQVLCLAVAVDDQHPRLWVTWDHQSLVDGLKDAELLSLIAHAEEIEAHNAEFERAVWYWAMHRRHGMPDIPTHKWRCTLSRAAAAALPRALEKVCHVLRLKEKKSDTGKDLIKRLCIARVPAPGENDNVTQWDTTGLEDLYLYCLQDVRTEQELSRRLPALSPGELDVWRLDQTINARGIQVDVASVEAIIAALRDHTDKLMEEFRGMETGLGSLQQVKKVVEFCETAGLMNLTKSAVAEALNRSDIPVTERRVLEIRQALGKSSIKKFEAFLSRTSSDGRLRGSLLYHAASTGRWGGRGVQLQNLPRAALKHDMVEPALECFRKGEMDTLELMLGADVTEIAKCLLRPMLIAAPGHDLICADFASIEARVLFWLAGETEALSVFESGGDIYCEMASAIYDRPVTKTDKMERQVGKTAILGLGYGMGPAKFLETCKQSGIEIDKQFSTRVVKAYRTKYSGVRNLWRSVESAAIEAATSRKTITTGRIKFRVRGEYLQCRLPSGRRLSYPYPRVEVRPCYTASTQDEYGEPGRIMLVTDAGKDAAEETIRQRAAANSEIIIGDMEEGKVRQLSHMAATGTGKWQREYTYGGKLVENIDQGTARDLMAAAMLRVEAAGYPVVLSVHDELVSEIPEGFGALGEFERLMAETPAWTDGLPVVAEGWRGKRYRK